MRAALAGAAVAATAPTRAVAQFSAGSAPPPTPAATQPASAAPLTPEQAVRQCLDHLAATLNQGSQQQRDEAAQRLVEIGSDDARLIVTRALSADDRAQNAAAKAIADGHTLDPQWLDPLVRQLGRDATVTNAARALVQYGTNASAVDALVRVARLRQQTDRATIIRILGQIVQMPVAEALIGILQDGTEDTSIRMAAADALGDMSGHADYGPDVHRWTDWWNARKGKSPADWRAQVLAEQHPVMRRQAVTEHDRFRQFVAAAKAQFNDQYTRLPPAEKPRMVLELLNNADPAMREIGAGLVMSAIGGGQPISDEIHARLIELVGDASPEVRHQVVTALKNLADPHALDAIVTQLAVETNPRVKVDLLDAIGHQQNAGRAVLLVAQAVHDPSPQVAAGAAKTLQDLATPINAQHGEARQIFQELNRVMQDRTGPPGAPNDSPGAAQLRAALVGAMAKFADADTAGALDLIPQLLSQNEPAAVRQAAIQGLVPLGERAAELIAQELSPREEPDASVRRQAAQALGEIGSFAYASRLTQSMRAESEPEERVREAAWKAFQSLLPAPTTTTQELMNYADMFHRERDPDHLDHEIMVRRELARKFQAAGDMQHLAIEQQRIGERYVQLDPPQWAKAVPYLQAALNFWEQAQGNQATVAQLVRDVMLDQLKSGQYHDAIHFAQVEIQRDPQNQEVIGPLIRNTADELAGSGDPAKIRAAAGLIDDALAMKNPPLDPTYRARLQDLKETLGTGTPG